MLPHAAQYSRLRLFCKVHLEQVQRCSDAGGKPQAAQVVALNVLCMVHLLHVQVLSASKPFAAIAGILFTGLSMRSFRLGPSVLEGSGGRGWGIDRPCPQGSSDSSGAAISIS